MLDHLSRGLPPAERSVMLNTMLALGLGSDSDWLGLAASLRALDPADRVAVAQAALAALSDAEGMDVVDAYATGAGWPLPPFEGLAVEARLWARDATPRELKFYAWAVVERLSPRDRRALAAKIAKMEASVPPQAARDVPAASSKTAREGGVR